MRKLIVVAILCALAISAVPQVVGAASTAYINITATGSEINITCNATLWALGTVESAHTDNTCNHDGSLFKWAQVINNTSEAVEITINGNEMENLAETVIWHLDSNGSPPAGDFSMRFGVDDTTDNFQTYSGAAYVDGYIREYDDGTFLKLAKDTDDSLGASENWTFAMEFTMGTGAGVGNEAVRMSDSAGSPTDDADDGICLTAAVA